MDVRLRQGKQILGRYLLDQVASEERLRSLHHVEEAVEHPASDVRQASGTIQMTEQVLFDFVDFDILAICVLCRTHDLVDVLDLVQDDLPFVGSASDFQKDLTGFEGRTCREATFEIWIGIGITEEQEVASVLCEEFEDRVFFECCADSAELICVRAAILDQDLT